MTRSRRIIALIVALVMAFTMLLPLTSCKDNNDPCEQHVDTDSDGKCDNCQESMDNDVCNQHVDTNGDGQCDNCEKPMRATYTVTVKTLYDMVLEDVMVYVHEGTDPNTYNNVARSEVDRDGEATFELDTSKVYSVELSGVKDGYTVQARYPFDATRRADIKLKSAPITDEDFKDVDYYEVGDVIHDFTVTDISGKEWTVSEVLKEQQLLVLNFWFSSCGPCASEFPYMISAYESYNEMYGNDGKNIVEIFAINDYGEAKGTIRDYTVGITDEDGNVTPSSLTFPTFRAEDSGFERLDFIRKFMDSDTYSYPTSVFIDRAGVICCIEVGAVPNAKAFTNAFDHFTAADYEQKLVDGIEDFTPISTPNVTPPSFDEIDEALTGNYRDTNEKIEVTYRFDDSELNWPFIITTLGGETCVRPSNRDIDNSYSIMYADVYLEEGDVLAFDYFSSTQKNNTNEDYMVLIVDGKDMFTISGKTNLPDDGESAEWSTCYTYVAQHSGTYELAFAYIKDIGGYVGEDCVFIKDLRVVDTDAIDTETYLFRYAAWNENENKNGFRDYAQVVYNETDGYYHVGRADGPILLAQLVDTYTQFDRNKTVFERLYANTDDYGNPVFIIDGVDYFKQMEKYGNYASNSNLPGYCPVTKELAGYLKAYTAQYRQAVGESANDNLWLQLCCYYDAYGTDGKEMEDPIKGLATFSAYDMVLGEKVTITYDRMIIPRGYLYAFKPTEAGVYRITSFADSAIIGWVFTSTSGFEAGDRIEYLNSEDAERISPELVFDGYKVTCPNCNKETVYAKKYDNLGEEIEITEVQCGDPICIDEDTGAVTVITDLTDKESVYSIDRNNVSMVGYMDTDTTYYIAFAFHNPEETGSFDIEMKYVGETFDKFVVASPGPFTFELGENGEMGETITGGIKVKFCDVDGCVDCAEVAAIHGVDASTKYYHSVNDDGSLGYVVFADFHMYTSTYTNASIVDLNNAGHFDFSDSPSKTDLDKEAVAFLDTMLQKGKEALYATWTGMTEDEKDEVWLSYCMDEVLRGNFGGLENQEDSAELIEQAREWKAYVESHGDSWLRTNWGANYDANWELYQMDDIKAGIYHGEAVDYTETMDAYAEMMLNEPGFPERQGCVAVDETLAHILQLLIDKEVFEDVENAWIKFCYYYDQLGPETSVED